jgi:TRAP-type C4-dicarboxylate transport system substrate-binding protein
MTLATAYVLGASRSYPIMQLDLKENIQNMTNGKVYVRLAPGGQLGAGGALAQAVQGGTIQCAQHSLANFAPFASVVDLINLPYFCGSNQRFTNLTSSDAWKPKSIPRSLNRASRRCSTSSSTHASWPCARAATRSSPQATCRA